MVFPCLGLDSLKSSSCVCVCNSSNLVPVWLYSYVKCRQRFLLLRQLYKHVMVMLFGHWVWSCYVIMVTFLEHGRGSGSLGWSVRLCAWAFGVKRDWLVLPCRPDMNSHQPPLNYSNSTNPTMFFVTRFQLLIIDNGISLGLWEHSWCSRVGLRERLEIPQHLRWHGLVLRAQNSR